MKILIKFCLFLSAATVIIDSVSAVNQLITEKIFTLSSIGNDKFRTTTTNLPTRNDNDDNNSNNVQSRNSFTESTTMMATTIQTSKKSKVPVKAHGEYDVVPKTGVVVNADLSSTTESKHMIEAPNRKFCSTNQIWDAKINGCRNAE